LALRPTHRLLELGCGPGSLLIPLSFRVASATGVDHPDTVARARERFTDPRVTFVGGFFPAVALGGAYDRLLIDGVVQCLPDWKSVLDFVDRAVDLLASGGRLLIGDIPNADHKKRFLDSDAGKAFEAAWRQQMATTIRADGSENVAAMFKDA